jgi:iron complex transport system substrate-binding protein
MRIVSLLPSLTEIVCLLGRQSELVGVTHECDFPPGVEQLPHLTRSVIGTSASSREIDDLVAQQAGSLYSLDTDKLRHLQPDLILTQSQCDVCAVNERTVREVAATLRCSPHVESVNPTNLQGVFEVFQRVGALVQARAAAEQWIKGFIGTTIDIQKRRAGERFARVLLLEWLDPPFIAGHWNPEILTLAGGTELLGKAGEPSRRTTWHDIFEVRPELMLIAPCGFTLDRSESELNEPGAIRDALLQLERTGTPLALVDGSAYFSRPGPRLETSLRIAAANINPGVCGDLAPEEGWKNIRIE